MSTARAHLTLIIKALICIGASTIVLFLSTTRIRTRVPVIGRIARTPVCRVLRECRAPGIVHALEVSVLIALTALTETRHARLRLERVVVRELVGRTHAAQVRTAVVVGARESAREALRAAHARACLC